MRTSCPRGPGCLRKLGLASCDCNWGINDPGASMVTGSLPRPQRLPTGTNPTTTDIIQVTWATLLLVGGLMLVCLLAGIFGHTTLI